MPVVGVEEEQFFKGVCVTVKNGRCLLQELAHCFHDYCCVADSYSPQPLDAYDVYLAGPLASPN